MKEIPSGLKYSKTHEWVEEQGDSTVRVGISDHAQALLGDMVFVELPEVGSTVSAGEECAVVESVKAASDVYSPVSGEVVTVNESLVDNPEKVNQAPYGDGWIMTVRLTQPDELAALMDADDYRALVEAEAH